MKRTTSIKTAIAFPTVTILAVAVVQVQAEVITVPNGNFESVYKPGSTTITARLDIKSGRESSGWTQGVGPDAPMDTDRFNVTIASYSDGTTGNSVDIPGWIGADRQGWIAYGGTYGRDQTTGNRQGSVARQLATPDGSYYYLANGKGFSNRAGGLIVSDASLATIENQLTYKLSMISRSRYDVAAEPVVLDLLADGVALTPSSLVHPVSSGEWQVFSRTYDAASLSGHLGKSLTIQLGVGREAIGNQSMFDAVSLNTIPEVSYGSWISTKFDESYPASDLLPGADPDFDQSSNLLEFGFGSDPADGSSQPRVSLSREEAGFFLVYLRHSNAPTLVYTPVYLPVGVSTVWIPLADMPLSVTIPAYPAPAGYEWVKQEIPSTTAAGLARMRIEMNTPE